MSPTPREERLAENEALFRVANERMADWEEQHADGKAEVYMCECAEPACREKVTLTVAQYEQVRADPRHFVVIEGHEIPDVETVVERGQGWAIVEKPPDVDETIEPLDPRST